MGFDECRYHRKWPKEDVSLLKMVSEIIAMVLERQRTREKLVRNQALFRSAIESLPFDFFALDREGRYTITNSTARRRWGDSVGKRPADIMKDEKILGIWNRNNRRALSGETIRGEIHYHLNGKAEHIYNVVSPVWVDDKVQGVVGVNIDITDLKQTKDELKSSEQNYRFLVETMREVFYILDL